MTTPAAVPDVVGVTAPTNDAAGIRETHTGVVILMGDHAYKLKKPVRTDFLDFTTVESRERVCQREVTLNRRLAPHSYFGVGHFQLPGNEPAEPVIVMRRYPERYRLRSMIIGGEPVEHHLAAIADLLATFHRQAQGSPIVDHCAWVDAISVLWQENLAELEDHYDTILATDMVRQARHLAMQYLAGRTALFDARIAEGRIVDGHGDLTADDIFCAPAGPILLDCLEFDDTLRCVDGLDDAAFLAMDLEYLDRTDLAANFLERYRGAANDTAPLSLEDFYTAYRAIVRAKVDCLRFTQGGMHADDDARRHLDLALEHLRAATVRLIVVGGGPGTGKTTLAHALADTVDAVVISTDVVRRELQRTGSIGGAAGAVDAGLYAPVNVATVYDVVLQRAADMLAGGQSVVLDGTWRDPRQREKAHDVATRSSAVLIELACVADLSTAQHRIEMRSSDTSDATPRIAAEIDVRPWSGAHPIDTGRPLAESVAQAQQHCRLAG